MLRNAIFSTCRGICLRKVDLEYENGKQLQVTIIKVTESKENRSIHRLDVSGSIGPGGQLGPGGGGGGGGGGGALGPPLPPPPPPPIATVLIFLHLWVTELFGFHCCNEFITGLHLPYMSKTGRHSLSREGLNACTFLIVKTYLPKAHMSHGMTENQEE